MRSRLNGSMPPQLSYESQLGLFLALSVPGITPVVPGVDVGLRTLRVEWHLEHFWSSATTPLLLAGMLPIAGMSSRLISWTRKFFSAASHCMYSIELGWAPG